ncbi:hypothetical protein AV656_08125 [Bhargavaea cecembensis]|uniref:Uncharacterized protein n=1 Tax=Bhargavaea cecembensis TaxID=394098 RepID=A0A165H5S2_9BACL|nr:hypothetical protein [Bhargavaea cecembensis]KZE38858.1 hypothetical protein AV656_08125 [Bhargavaea cecembensis]
MKGSICLIRVSNEKTVPAICLDDSSEKLLFAQIRSAREEEIPIKKRDNPQSRPLQNKKSQTKKPRLSKSLYIGQPEGVKSKSVVMVTKQYQISPSAVIKIIFKGEYTNADMCLKLLKRIERENELHKELKILKKKLNLASINNERGRDYEARIDEILKELGYFKPGRKKKNNKAFRNFREVPNKGYIKVYLGGR